MPRVRGGRFSATSNGRAFPNVGGVRGGRFSATNRGWRFPPAAAAAGVFVKGSFAKATGAAPASQTVAHGLGATPKALIMWATPDTAEGTASHANLAFGTTDGTTTRGVAIQSEDGSAAADCDRHHSANLITLLDVAGTTIAQASFTSWDATNFTISWDTNDANAYIVHFVAISGVGVSTKVVEWTMPLATGNQAVTGVGFQPGTVLHFTARRNDALPATGTSSAMCVGVMNAAGEQWTSSFSSLINADPTSTAAGQVTDSCLLQVDPSIAEGERASFVSMDADGFTVNFSNISAVALRVFSLCLRGLSSKIGSFNKSTSGAPASQSVTGAAFQPKLVLLQTWGSATSASPAGNAIYSLGASDGTTEGTAAVSDENAQGTTDTGRATKTSKAIAILSATAPATIAAEADMTSLDSGGFTLSWTTNNATAVEMLYLALA